MNTERIILRNTEKINDDGTIELIQQETEPFLFNSVIELKNITTSDKTVEHLKIFYYNSEELVEQDWMQFRKSSTNGFKQLPIKLIPSPRWNTIKIAMIDSKKDQENFEISFDIISEKE